MNYSGSGNYTFETVGATYRFVVPVRKDWLRIGISVLAVVFVVWIVWPSDWGLLAGDNVQAANLVLLVVIGVIIFGLVLQLLEIVWQLLGREVLEVSDDAVIVRHQVLAIGPSRKVPADKVTGLAVASTQGGRSGWNTRRDYQFLSFRYGRIVVSGGKGVLRQTATVRFGTGLDEGEAQQVVDLILNRFPQYKVQTTSQ